jgi:hypothetical protein
LKDAYHEAGHAVVAAIFGAEVKEVSIRPGRRGRIATAGHCRYDLPAGPAHFSCIQYHIAAHLAGSLAEAKAAGAADAWSSLGDRDDIAKLKGEMDSELVHIGGRPYRWPRLGAIPLTRRTKEQMVHWLTCYTRDLLDHFRVWGAVRTLAERLVEKGRLSGKQVHALLTKAGIEKLPDV